jgi:hypothetical protein
MDVAHNADRLWNVGQVRLILEHIDDFHEQFYYLFLRNGAFPGQKAF